MTRSAAVWLLRALWFLLPLTVGQAAGDAIASAPHAMPQVLTVGLWTFWALGAVASAVTVPLSLTVIRTLSPGAFAVALWALIDTDAAGNAILALVHAALVCLAGFNHLIGDRFVDGASYGDERRMLLRPPLPLALIVAPLAWLAAAAGVSVGPLLLADRRWIAGVIAVAIGGSVTAVVARALHQLSIRWIVFVPTGMVVHDHTALTEPVLFRRTAIERLGPAVVGSPARDLSSGAVGLLLECELADAAPLGLRDGGGASDGSATMTDVRRFLFSPTRPGELLDEAERRGIAVASELSG